jgi:hypothetical protein
MKQIMHYARVLSARRHSHLPGLPVIFQLGVSVVCLVAAFAIRDDVLSSAIAKSLSIICSLNLLRSLSSQ